MDTNEFVAYLETFGVEGNFLQSSRPKLTERLAATWKQTHVFSRALGQAFIGDLDGRPITDREALALRQISGLHATFRASICKRAPTEFLRKIGEDKVAMIERDQMPVTASMASILKEGHALLASDNLGSLAFLRSNAIDLNQKDRDGLTACAIAAQNGSDKCLFALCKNLANPHVCDSMGNTPLHWACAMAQGKVLSILLYHGANPNAVSDNGVTPLMLVLAKSNLELAQKLLEYGADLRMKDRRGNTALHRTVQAKNPKACSFLLDCGSAIDEPNLDGSTPLGMAMRVPELTSMFLAEQGRSQAGSHAMARG